MQVLYYFPGQEATIFLETVDNHGARIDSATQPAVTRIVFPDLSLATGFPQDMVKLDTGLYYFRFTLPTHAIAIGSYLVEVSYTNFNTFQNTVGYQIIVSAPFGNFSTVSF